MAEKGEGNLVSIFFVFFEAFYSHFKGLKNSLTVAPHYLIDSELLEEAQKEMN
jgi:hypothetical protein